VPIHAAGVYTGALNRQECCADYVVSSYAPTLSALQRAREGLHSKARDALTLMSAYAKTTTVPGMEQLEGVEEEAAVLSALAEKAHLSVIRAGGGASASIRDVVDGLASADIVHLACHGVQDLRNPLQSGFCLRDGKLTVAQLMDAKLDRAFLAFLSACETAKGDAEQPDQTVHLAAAMLYCGFRSVIATLW
jgi:CHAT domain-containing protein